MHLPGDSCVLLPSAQLTVLAGSQDSRLPVRVPPSDPACLGIPRRADLVTRKPFLASLCLAIMKPLLFAALALASPALLAAPPAPRIDYHQHLISPAFAAIVQIPGGLVEEPIARGTLCSSAS